MKLVLGKDNKLYKDADAVRFYPAKCVARKGIMQSPITPHTIYYNLWLDKCEMCGIITITPYLAVDGRTKRWKE